MEQFLVIDLRAASDIELSGGGIIPRAVHIEPDFLSSPDALERWIEHFDGTRGCNICILDLPPVQATSGTLWYVRYAIINRDNEGATCCIFGDA